MESSGSKCLGISKCGKSNYFWKIWSSIYVPSLREKHQKTKGPMKNIIKVGDVVQTSSTPLGGLLQSLLLVHRVAVVQ